MLCVCAEPLLDVTFDISSRKFCAKKYEEVSGKPCAKSVCFENNYVYELLAHSYGSWLTAADKKILVGGKLEGPSPGSHVV